MKILIPVDGSPYSDAALRFVATRRFRKGQRPQIDLLNVQLPIPPRAGRVVGAEIVRAMHEAESAKVLKPAVSLLRAAQLEPAWQYRVGSPAVEIVEWAEAHGSDLIVIGSHGHTALKALVFGSVTQKVLASTHVPMLTLRAAKPPRRASLRVGIALDGSAYGIAAARYVLAHLPLFGPRPAVALIHVVEPTAAAALDMDQPDSSGEPLSSAAADATAEILAPVRAQFEQAGVAVREELLVGEPGEEIVRFARSRRLDLLAMGSHGRGAFTAALLGSVARRVAATCTTPLLLLRPPEGSVAAQ